jgi:hypothetical protein
MPLPPRWRRPPPAHRRQRTDAPRGLGRVRIYMKSDDVGSAAPGERESTNPGVESTGGGVTKPACAQRVYVSGTTPRWMRAAAIW